MNKVFPRLPAAAYAVKLSMFGSFTINIVGKVSDDWHSVKGRALLAYLVMARGKPILRTHLIEILWHGYPVAAARANLRQILSLLRKMLAPYDLIHADYQTIQLKLPPSVVWCDVLHFAALLESCRHHEHSTITSCAECQTRLREVVGLYKAPFLAQPVDLDSSSFQAWRQTQQAYFAQLFAEAQFMLRLDILPAGNLPTPLTPLIGRVIELHHVSEQILDPRYRGVTLVGPGGIGKTRLALAAGPILQPYFPDGVWLVELAAIPAIVAPAQDNTTLDQSFDRIATAISSVLDLPLQSKTRPIEQLLTYLQNKTLLLILDNFEQLSPAVVFLEQLLAHAPQLRLLVTSRHRLTLLDCPVYVVEGLAVPPLHPEAQLSPIEGVARYAALQLFVERATNALLPLALDETTLVSITQLCRLVEGIPLSIEWMAALVETQSPTMLLERVHTTFAALQVDLEDLPPRQRSAQAVFLTSWCLLSVREAQILARCTVFHGCFTATAARAITDATEDDLQALVAQSLLHVVEEEHYRLDEMVRQLAAEQLAQDPTMAVITRARHALYYLTFVGAWQTEMRSARLFPRMIPCNRENVEAAWAWANGYGRAEKDE